MSQAGQSRSEFEKYFLWSWRCSSKLFAQFHPWWSRQTTSWQSCPFRFASIIPSQPLFSWWYLPSQ